jgi:hypothetical protein
VEPALFKCNLVLYMDERETIACSFLDCNTQLHTRLNMGLPYATTARNEISGNKKANAVRIHADDECMQQQERTKENAERGCAAA